MLYSNSWVRADEPLQIRFCHRGIQVLYLVLCIVFLDVALLSTGGVSAGFAELIPWLSLFLLKAILGFLLLGVGTSYLSVRRVEICPRLVGLFGNGDDILEDVRAFIGGPRALPVVVGLEVLWVLQLCRDV